MTKRRWWLISIALGVLATIETLAAVWWWAVTNMGNNVGGAHMATVAVLAIGSFAAGSIAHEWEDEPQ